MSFAALDHAFVFPLNAETLGRMFMPRASSFEVLKASIIQEYLVLDSLRVKSTNGSCRLTFSEWEEDQPGKNQPLWISEFAIELTVDEVVAFATYSISQAPDRREAGLMLERLRRDAEEDFMLCAKLLGRSVRRDLVIDEETPDQPTPGANLH
jgi:hypothetical protein